MFRNSLSRLSRTGVIAPQNSQFIQRFPVSGTAKGKAKLKAGQPLKRSSIPKKKGAKPETESRGRFNETNRINEMAEASMNAPTPIRYLTPKQKEREAEREKMGLISKDRQREIDQLKKKKDGAQEPTETMGTPGLDLISLGLVDLDKIPKYELTVEDGRRLAKEYSRILMRRTRARQAAETTLLRLKKEAIATLPENLREAALVPDLTPFPTNRFMATLTPPIEGYLEKMKQASRTTNVKQKLR